MHALAIDAFFPLKTPFRLKHLFAWNYFYFETTFTLKLLALFFEIGIKIVTKPRTIDNDTGVLTQFFS